MVPETAARELSASVTREAREDWFRNQSPIKPTYTGIDDELRLLRISPIEYFSRQGKPEIRVRRTVSSRCTIVISIYPNVAIRIWFRALGTTGASWQSGYLLAKSRNDRNKRNSIYVHRNAAGLIRIWERINGAPFAAVYLQKTLRTGDYRVGHACKRAFRRLHDFPIFARLYKLIE